MEKLKTLLIGYVEGQPGVSFRFPDGYVCSITIKMLIEEIIRFDDTLTLNVIGKFLGLPRPHIYTIAKGNTLPRRKTCEGLINLYLRSYRKYYEQK